MALSSHFLTVAQAKLLLIQEESAWARTLQSPKYFAESKYKNYSPTTEQHQPLGGMQEQFNSAHKCFPTGLDKSWRIVCPIEPTTESNELDEPSPSPCYIGWVSNTYPSTTRLPPGGWELCWSSPIWPSPPHEIWQDNRSKRLGKYCKMLQINE